ncbi:MAG: hypothetical protein V9E94_04700 [Microthrixaceae bacterium]
MGELILHVVSHHVMNIDEIENVGLVGSNIEDLKKKYDEFLIQSDKILSESWASLENLLETTPSALSELSKLQPLSDREKFVGDIKVQFHTALNSGRSDEWGEFMKQFPQIKDALDIYNREYKFDWKTIFHILSLNMLIIWVRKGFICHRLNWVY